MGSTYKMTHSLKKYFRKTISSETSAQLSVQTRNPIKLYGFSRVLHESAQKLRHIILLGEALIFPERKNTFSWKPIQKNHSAGKIWKWTEISRLRHWRIGPYSTSQKVIKGGAESGSSHLTRFFRRDRTCRQWVVQAKPNLINQSKVTKSHSKSLKQLKSHFCIKFCIFA